MSLYSTILLTEIHVLLALAVAVVLQYKTGVKSAHADECPCIPIPYYTVMLVVLLEPLLVATRGGNIHRSDNHYILLAVAAISAT